MKTILVPTDFSEQALNALDLAAQIAKKSEAKIILTHVIEGARSFSSFNTMGEGGSPVGEDAFLIKRLVEAHEKNLSDLKESPMLEGLQVETRVKVGSPYESISQAVSDDEADLVVMGTKGSSGLDEVLIGSNTEKVVRYASCPVITVKNKVALTSIESIVFATDLSDNQDRLVSKVKDMQKMLNAKLHLLKVNTPSHFYTNRQLEEEFDKFIEEHELENFTTNVYNEATEEDGILYFAEEVGACMIAIGTHGRTGLLHLLSGSIAEDLVNHADIPVWTLSMKH